MSLNGLDNASIKEAHEAAAAEPGGWFLLKYASRDEVDVYSRGAGGIVEMRNAITKYEESSPLYGFLRYRRRNVILKYQPEDCSRLVQARATVHFNAVCERFTPYNATFEITAAKELKDTKLSAACSLHTASGSSSSSTSSLRRRRLMEIAEEEEEEERERKRQSVVQEERPGTADANANGNGETGTSPPPPIVLDRDQFDAAKEPNFASTSEKRSFEGVPCPPSPAKSEFNVRDGRRFSTQTARPELYSYSTYTYGKPKVKLAPRPSMDASTRPHTAGNFRPVAALPAGFKLTSKGSRKGRPQDKTTGEDRETTNLSLFQAAIPEAPQESDATLLPPRPATSSGASLKSISFMAPMKENKMTPEKMRLMKAMKMREQKKKQSMIATISQPASIEEDPTSGDGVGSLSDGPKSDVPEDELGVEERSELSRSLSDAESVAQVDLPTPATLITEADTEETLTDSHPPSPTIASSEIGDSTKASSLSESTDETIQHPTKVDESDLRPGDDSQENEQSEAEVDTETDAPTAPRRLLEDGVHADATDGLVSQRQGLNTSSDPLIQAEPQLESIRQSIEVDDTPKQVSDIRTQEIIVPSKDEEVSSPRSPYGIPISKFSSNESARSPPTPSLRSKFSTQDLKAPADSVPPVPTLVTSPSATTPEPREAQQEVVAQVPASEEAPLLTLSAQSSMRRLAISPIRTDLAKDTPDSELTDPLLDDALMDELQSATVEEAQPIMVSKSPITPVFPSTSPKRPQTVSGGKPQAVRTFSNPMRGPLLVPGDVSSSSARSVSAGGAAFLHNITRQPSNAGSLAAKKGVGSSISQRIKALEQLSGKNSNEDLRPKTATPTTSFISVRQPSVRKSKSPSVVDRANTFHERTPTPERSREGSPDIPGKLVPRERSGSVASRLSMFEGAPSPRGRPESIQVTARIVRDPNQAFPKRPASKDPAEYNTPELKQSPLVVDHVRAERADYVLPSEPVKLPTIEPPKETIRERRLSRDRQSLSEDEVGKKRRSSLSIVKDFIKDRRSSITSKSTDNLMAAPPVMSPAMSPAPSSTKSGSRPPSVHQNSAASKVRRLSISSRRSFSRERGDTPTPVMSPVAFTDPGSEDDKASLGDKKSKSRTSRFMRRLSNSLGGSRKNLPPNISPTVAEEADEVSTSASAAGSRNPSQPSLATYMGDVNVQFPDNLLWKRRSLCLDTQGFLMLSAVQGAAGNGTEKTGLKRYHLSDFRLPYIPDVDIQELPNSIVLDFVEGSGLQLACEDRMGQKHILQALQDAHRSHTAFGQ